MWLTTHNVMAVVASATPEEHKWLQGYLSFTDSGFRKSSKRVSLYHLASASFPGGLLPLVLDAGKRDNITIGLIDKRTSNLQVDVDADLDWLRDYQLDAVEAIARERRGIIRAPTGSGKTECFVALTQKLPGRWLMLVHRDTLVDQASDRYTLRTGRVANVLSRVPAQHWRLAPGLNAMTFQTLAAALRRDTALVDQALAVCDGLIIDEAHVAPADTYFRAVQRCPAEYRVGFSGTPLDRTDNRSLMAIAALGRVIYSIKATTLIESGVLARPRITMIPVAQKFQAQGQVARGARAYSQIYSTHVSGSDARNMRVVELVRDAPKPCMVFVKEIEHGHALKKACEQAGLNTEFVFGGTKSHGRKGSIQRLERGDADVLIASVVFQEGVDIPSLESVIIASGGKSVIAALQRIGRGMRTNNGAKTDFKVYDILDLGIPSLEKHARRRMNTYVREGYATMIAERDGSLKAYAPRLKTRAEKRGE